MDAKVEWMLRQLVKEWQIRDVNDTVAMLVVAYLVNSEEYSETNWQRGLELLVSLAKLAQSQMKQAGEG